MVNTTKMRNEVGTPTECMQTIVVLCGCSLAKIRASLLLSLFRDGPSSTMADGSNAKVWLRPDLGAPAEHYLLLYVDVGVLTTFFFIIQYTNILTM